MKVPKIELYCRGKNGIFWVRYSFNGKREHYSLNTTDEAEARDEVARIEYEIKVGIHRPMKQLIFDKLWERYKKEAWLEKRESSIKRDELSIKTLNMFFGGKIIREENLRSQAREYRVLRKDGAIRLPGSRKDKVSGATVNREIALLKHMISLATNEWQILRFDPLKKLKMFREIPRNCPILPDVWRRLIAASNDELRDFLILSRRTAIRHGVVDHGMLDIKWSDIDLENGIIYLRDSKNGLPYKVFMDEPVHRILIRRKNIATSEYLFPGRNGNRRYSFYGLFNKAKKKAGIVGSLRIHDLRHQFATDKKSNGADGDSLAKVMGLTSTAMLRVYGNPNEAHLRKIMGSKLPKPQSSGPEMDQNDDDDTHE